MPKVFIVGEAGSNHDGSLERALELINIAIDAKCDAVKFQLIPPFQPEWIDKLIAYCGDRIEFMATPFNENGINALRGKVKHWKIAATEAADKEFMDKVIRAAKGDPVFISDGAVENPNDLLNENVVPLACVVKYPAEPTDYCLKYEGRWGLSDHTLGPTLAIIAVAAGASVVEKHFTDDKKRDGPDHSYAADPEELAALVDSIRITESLFTNPKLTIKDYVGRELQWP